MSLYRQRKPDGTHPGSGRTCKPHTTGPTMGIEPQDHPFNLYSKCQLTVKIFSTELNG